VRNVFLILAVAVTLSGSLLAQAPPQVDILGSHDLSEGRPSPVKGQAGQALGSAACLYCHAPHSGLGGRTPLWSQTLSTQPYTLYSSNTIQNVPAQPLVGGPSSLCLSCHDGTVALGAKVPYGTIVMSSDHPVNTADVFGTELQTSHPFSLRTPLVDAANLVSTLASSRTTADPLHKVKLVGGTVECSSCHQPHAQYIGDPLAGKFLVRDNRNGQICLACHTGTGRAVNGKNNRLAQWSTSIHALSANTVAGAVGLGNYSTVGQYACLSCHKDHNANGSAGLLRAAVPAATGVDASTQSCMTCHAGGTNLDQAIANVYAKFGAPNVGHPLPTGSNLHDGNEPAVLLEKRHATCVDCHNPHSSFQVAAFAAPPNVRGSQTGTVGISANDGSTIVDPAIDQYQVCLRCHGNSPNKQAPSSYGYLPLRAVSAADALNVIPQLAATATSSHPVLHTGTSGWPQPSLLTYMLNLDGTTNSTRAVNPGGGSRIFCTDCHNDDDNREFGGSGPNGPHGTQYSHVLERRYEFAQVAVGAGPGTTIANAAALTNPSLNAGGASPGPYAMCGKCHDLSMVMTAASWNLTSNKAGHLVHVSQQGASCSACHTAHGMGSMSATVTGERLVNFDVGVVAPNAAALGSPPITYNHATNTCTLTCHGYAHEGATVAPAAARVTVITK